MINVKKNTAIHVKTQEEYNSLMKELEESGFNIGGTLPTDWGVWKEYLHYKQGICINIENKDWLGYSEINFYQKEGYTIEEYRPEFRVGDTVEIVRKYTKNNFYWIDEMDKMIGKTGVIEQIGETRGTFLLNNYWYLPQSLKLISRAEEPKPVENKMYSTDGETWSHICPSEPKTATEVMTKERAMQLEENYRLFNKLNKKTFMTNIVEFAKNQALKATNPDEFALRTAGLKDQEGNWTAEARKIVIDFKAVQLGFKNYDDLINEIGYNGEYSAFEIHALFIEFAADLLKIAQEKLASEAKK